MCTDTVRSAPFELPIYSLLCIPVFLLFQEPADGYTVHADAPEYGTELEARRRWSALDFAKKYKLTLVGANYFKLKSE